LIKSCTFVKTTFDQIFLKSDLKVSLQKTTFTFLKFFLEIFGQKSSLEKTILENINFFQKTSFLKFLNGVKIKIKIKKFKKIIFGRDDFQFFIFYFK
jgi:hypothetical protein